MKKADYKVRKPKNLPIYRQKANEKTHFCKYCLSSITKASLDFRQDRHYRHQTDAEAILK